MLCNSYLLGNEANVPFAIWCFDTPSNTITFHGICVLQCMVNAVAIDNKRTPQVSIYVAVLTYRVVAFCLIEHILDSLQFAEIVKEATISLSSNMAVGFCFCLCINCTVKSDDVMCKGSI